jgi:hypothetical protein
MVLAVYRGGTTFWVISEILLLAIAIGGYYRWKGPHGRTATPAALGKYRRGSLLSLLLAVLILIRLLTFTYS